MNLSHIFISLMKTIEDGDMIIINYKEFKLVIYTDVYMSYISKQDHQ